MRDWCFVARIRFLPGLLHHEVIFRSRELPGFTSFLLFFWATLGSGKIRQEAWNKPCVWLKAFFIFLKKREKRRKRAWAGMLLPVELGFARQPFEGKAVISYFGYNYLSALFSFFVQQCAQPKVLGVALLFPIRDAKMQGCVCLKNKRK